VFRNSLARIFLLQVIWVCFLSADDTYAPVTVYSSIKDIYHPTLDDYKFVQNYLTYSERSILKRLNDYESIVRNLKIIGNTPDELPQSGMIAVNCDPNERENCIVCYSTFNKNYPRGLKRLVELVTKSDFKGHIMYQIGGWPNVEEGSFVLAHLPYAFKVCILKEAKRLGFKRALWLDTSIVPVVSLNEIFNIIEEKGYFVMGNAHMVGPYMHAEAANAFGLTLETTYQIPSCSAGITGFDFTNDIALQIVNALYQAAHNPVAFFSSRPEQNALSIIFWSFGLSKDLIDFKRCAQFRHEIGPQTLLFINREFVHY
jgi:hypothetical protein